MICIPIYIPIYSEPCKNVLGKKGSLSGKSLRNSVLEHHIPSSMLQHIDSSLTCDPVLWFFTTWILSGCLQNFFLCLGGYLAVFLEAYFRRWLIDSIYTLTSSSKRWAIFFYDFLNYDIWTNFFFGQFWSNLIILKLSLLHPLLRCFVFFLLWYILYFLFFSLLILSHEVISFHLEDGKGWK